MSKYREMVHAYAYCKVGSYQEAEDITQEVFIKAYRKLGQLRWPHRFQSWLYSIVANECKMWIRSRSRKRVQEVPLEEVSVDELNEIALRSDNDEEINLTVQKAMETLPDDRQLVLSLYYMSNLSVKEIAYFMGVSPNSIGIKLHRARKQLGERLEKMIGKHLSKEKLKAGFVFKVAESIGNMPIPSLPKPHPIRWAPSPIAIGIALLVGIIGYGISSGKDVPRNMNLLKPVETSFAVSLLPDSGEQKTLDMKTSDESQLVASYSGDDNAEEAGRSSDKEIAVRKVRFNEQVMGAEHIYPSPDGRYVSFANGKNGNLAILDLTTGESWDITDEGHWGRTERHAISSTWSPDGKQIAYHWFNEDTQELRIVGLDGSEPRVLHPSEESKGRIFGCYDWSQDGKYILAWLADPQRIVLIPVDGGSTRMLKSPAPRPEGMTLSPDSRYVVYDRPVKEHEDLRDIFLLTTDGSGEEIRLTEHPADDYDPVWSSDGKSIVFASNRTPDGTVGLWLTPIVDGKPAGKPQLVKKEVGDIRTEGFTEKGSLFYITMTSWSDIYVTSVDMETGELLSTPELLPSQGFNTEPTWSPDGESLAYESRRIAPGSFRTRPVLVIRSMKTGDERELILDQDIATWGTLGDLRWSPDGRSILCLPTYSLHLIDVRTGHVTANVVTGKGEAIRRPTWSHDGKTIFFTRMRFEKEDWPCRIVALDLETREERELYASGRRGGPLVVSPDGRQLAFSGEGESLKVIPTAGGEPRTLLRKDPNLRDTDFFGAPIAWTPDGCYVLYFIIKKFPSDEQPDGMVQLWRVPAEGGKPQKLLEMDGLSYGSLHPDGRRIAFQKGVHRQVDLWVMENLLPTSTASR